MPNVLYQEHHLRDFKRNTKEKITRTQERRNRLVHAFSPETKQHRPASQQYRSYRFEHRS